MDAVGVSYAVDDPYDPMSQRDARVYCAERIGVELVLDTSIESQLTALEDVLDLDDKPDEGLIGVSEGDEML